MVRGKANLKTLSYPTLRLIQTAMQRKVVLLSNGKRFNFIYISFLKSKLHTFFEAPGTTFHLSTVEVCLE